MGKWKCKTERTATDENQQKYREFFGIEDQYLIGYEMDTDEKDKKDSSEDSGYIVFIDFENDIDWINKGYQGKWSDAEKTEFMDCVAKLANAEAVLLLNLSDEEELTFKRMLGAIYIMCFNRNFECVDQMIADAVSFVKRQNTEQSRKILLISAGIVAVLFIVIALIMVHFVGKTCSWFFSVVMGVLGSYVSIWSRYGKEIFTGQSSCVLLVMESTSRMLIGAIFAVVAILSIKSGFIFSSLEMGVWQYLLPLVCFLSGFNERFISSLMETLGNKNSKKDNE